MINGVKFILSTGKVYHSWNDFALIRSSKIIGKPQVKKYVVDISGADGQLDFTEYFGEPKYNNRKLSFNFSCKQSMATWNDLYSDIQNKLHGQQVKVILDDDSGFYYIGRCDVNEWKSNKSIGQITIDVDAEPYKYKLEPTVIENDVDGSATLSFNNLRKNVVPTIKTTAAINITFGNKEFALGAGTYILPDMIFKEGTNTMDVTGTATVTVTYQEGGL